MNTVEGFLKVNEVSQQLFLEFDAWLDDILQREDLLAARPSLSEPSLLFT